MSRRATFTEKLRAEVGDVYQFFQPLNISTDSRQMILIPNTVVRRECTKIENVDVQIPIFKPEDDSFLSIVHTALKIRKDLKSFPGHSGLNISNEASAKVVSNSLHLFLSVLLQGESVALDTFGSSEENEDDMYKNDDDDFEIEGEDTECPLYNTNNVILSIAQDIVYAASERKKLTPKHVGLALTLHQATHNKKLVNLFHAAGHCMSYQKVLEADCSLAAESFKNFDRKSGAVTPQNLINYSNF